MASMNRAPVVIIGCGNPSRGDDALGPCLLEQLAQTAPISKEETVAELITDFQLQIEHVTDLEGRTLSLFIDASVSARPPFEFSQVYPQRDHSYSSHSLSPATLLSVFEEVYQAAPPPSYLLTIPGYQFELGMPLSRSAAGHLQGAIGFIEDLLRYPQQTYWERRLRGRRSRFSGDRW